MLLWEQVITTVGLMNCVSLKVLPDGLLILLHLCSPMPTAAVLIRLVRISSLKILSVSLAQAKRKVQKDRSVSLDGLLYEIDASLVNETVLLRYDPAGRRGQSLKVWHKGRFIHEAKLVNAYANCYVKRNRPSQNPQPAASAPVPAELATAAPAPLPGLRLADMPATDTDHKEGR